MCLSLSLSLALCLSIFVFLFLSLSPSVYLYVSLRVSVYLSNFFSLSRYFCLFLFLCLFLCLSNPHSISLSRIIKHRYPSPIAAHLYMTRSHDSIPSLPNQLGRPGAEFGGAEHFFDGPKISE